MALYVAPINKNNFIKQINSTLKFSRILRYSIYWKFTRYINYTRLINIKIFGEKLSYFRKIFSSFWTFLIWLSVRFHKFRLFIRTSKRKIQACNMISYRRFVAGDMITSWKTHRLSFYTLVIIIRCDEKNKTIIFLIIASRCWKLLEGLFSRRVTLKRENNFVRYASFVKRGIFFEKRKCYIGVQKRRFRSEGKFGTKSI